MEDKGYPNLSGNLLPSGAGLEFNHQAYCIGNGCKQDDSIVYPADYRYGVGYYIDRNEQVDNCY